MDRKAYEEDLRRRQEEHLRAVRGEQAEVWRPCLHDECPNCLGTGVGRDGRACIHGVSCPCPKCTPSCSTPASEAMSVVSELSKRCIVDPCTQEVSIMTMLEPELVERMRRVSVGACSSGTGSL